MEIREERTPETVVLAPQGRLDEKASAALEARVHERMLEGERHFVVDLSAAESLSGAALRVLLMLCRKLGSARGRLVLASPSDPVVAALEISGFAGAFAVRATLEEAMAASPSTEADAALERAARILGLHRDGSGEPPPPSAGDPDLAARAAALLCSSRPTHPRPASS
jgi:anti-anti-sigma factor